MLMDHESQFIVPKWSKSSDVKIWWLVEPRFMEIFIIMKHPGFSIQISLVEWKFNGKKHIFLMYTKNILWCTIFVKKMNVAKLTHTLELVTSPLSPRAGPLLVVPNGVLIWLSFCLIPGLKIFFLFQKHSLGSNLFLFTKFFVTDGWMGGRTKKKNL